MYVYMYVYVYIYIYIHTHTYIQAYSFWLARRRAADVLRRFRAMNITI